MSTALRAAFTVAQRTLYASLITGVTNAVAGAWAVTVVDASDETLALWQARYVSLVSGGQRLAAASSARAVWAALEASRGTLGALPAVAPVLVSAEDAWTASAILRLRKHLADGMQWHEAKGSAGSYAEYLAAGDVQASRNHGADGAAGAAEQRLGEPVAFAKTPPSNACSWCNLVSGQLYRHANRLPAHLPRDHCGMMPVTREDAGGYSNARTVFGAPSYAYGRGKRAS